MTYMVAGGREHRESEREEEDIRNKERDSHKGSRIKLIKIRTDRLTDIRLSDRDRARL